VTVSEDFLRSVEAQQKLVARQVAQQLVFPSEGPAFDGRQRMGDAQVLTPAAAAWGTLQQYY
jgi:hypothetical protein